MEEKIVSCNFCGEKRSNLLLINNDHTTKKNIFFKIVGCKKCGLVYINPRPSNIEKYYSDNYEPYNPKKRDIYFSFYRALIKSYYKKEKSLTDLLKSFLCRIFYSQSTDKCGRVLDIGCGSGGYLGVLNESGWEVYGIDFSKQVVEFAKESRGLKNVKLGNAEKLEFPDNFFDLVTMNHLIEHLSNPKKALVEAKRVLRKGGILVITTPNFSSFNAKIFGKNWFPLETPRHLFLFETLTLKKMVEGIKGLKIIRIKHDYSAYCLGKSIGYFLGNQPLINRYLMTIKIIFWPYTILLSLFGRSDIMTFYIKKNESS